MKRWIKHSDHKTRPLGELRHRTESLFSFNQLWAQRICWATHRKIYFLNTDLSVIMANCELHGWFVFLPQLMAICRRQVTKHSFLMMQALVTCCWRLAGQNKCSFAEIIHTSNLYGKYMTGYMCPWCNLPLLRGWGGGEGGKGNLSQKFLIQTGLGLRYISRMQDLL